MALVSVNARQLILCDTDIYAIMSIYVYTYCIMHKKLAKIIDLLIIAKYASLTRLLSSSIYIVYMSRVMRKQMFCICENKEANQLRRNREADQHLCFHYIDSTIPLLSKSEISSLYPYSVAVQPGLCGTWSETRMLVFS